MPVTLIGAGGLFTRLGKIGFAINSVRDFLRAGDLSAGGIKSLGVNADAIVDAFESSRQDLSYPVYPARDTYRKAHGTYLAALRTLAQNVLVEMVNDDTPLPAKTVLEALKELRRQMIATSDYISPPTVSATVAAGGSNVGTGKLIASVKAASGVQLDYLFEEVVKATVVTDGQGTGTEGKETFSIKGEAAQLDYLAYDWPLGSGASVSLNAVDADVNNDGKNVLQNSSFATYSTANAPDNWPKDTGTPGTTYGQATGSNSYKGNSGLYIAGNGVELTSLSQPFSTTPSTTLNAGGTSYAIKPSTVYGINFWAKVSSAPAAGVMEVALIDGAGNITTDAEGVENKITQAVTALDANWLAINGFFRTPAAHPASGYKLRIRLTTAITNTHTLYLDHFAMTPATQLYAGGPYVAIFSGATEFLIDDYFNITVANDYGSKWAVLLERLFGLRALGVIIPSDPTETILDSLIA